MGLSRVWLTISLLAASFGLNIHWSNANPDAAFYSPFTRMWELSAGGALAALAPSKNAPPGAFRRYAGALAALLGAALVVGAALLLKRSVQYPGYWPIIPVGGGGAYYMGRAGRVP